MKRKIFVLILTLVFAVCMQPAIAGAAEGEPLKRLIRLIYRQKSTGPA